MSKYIALSVLAILIMSFSVGAQEPAAVPAEQPSPVVAAPEASQSPTDAAAATDTQSGKEADQSAPADDQPAPADDQSTSADDQSAAEDTLGKVTEQAQELAADTQEKVDEIANTLDQSQTVQQASSGVLKPIYTLAESLAFPAFYWVAFALMAAGTVSYAFQLVLGKVVVLANGSMNIKEILSDTVGLVICLIGLVLTTQAATENSTFAESPTSVLSATVAGGLLGLFLYRWGQAEEVEAAKGRKQQKQEKKQKQ